MPPASDAAMHAYELRLEGGDEIFGLDTLPGVSRRGGKDSATLFQVGLEWLLVYEGANLPSTGPQQVAKGRVQYPELHSVIQGMNGLKPFRRDPPHLPH